MFQSFYITKKNKCCIYFKSDLTPLEIESWCLDDLVQIEISEDIIYINKKFNISNCLSNTNTNKSFHMCIRFKEILK